MLRIFLILSLFFAALFADLKVVNNSQLAEMQNKNVVVIDIRTLGEWKEYGIIQNAKPITFFDEKGKYDTTKWLNEFSKYVKDKNQTFVIYCAHANRTKMLGNFLNKQLGYENVYELEGGINYGWIDKGMKTIEYK
ncbi:rhodanese-like domain-containing protein [Arcobacter sp. s6]|jgi:rhodanese-related sulfurtransferase|uniref:rhodanese-like domain-containing protein n=1 Tax=Arcobacter sp. s6 TaxID=3230363 RepID=UPI0034A02E33